MIYAVIDTNVIVSAMMAKGPHGTRVGAFLAASTGIITGDLLRNVRDGSPRVFHHCQT